MWISTARKKGENILGYPFEKSDPFQNIEESKNIKSSNIVLNPSLYENIAYMKIRNFNCENVKLDRDQILDFYKKIEQKDHLIIDITNNSGGDTAYWMFNLVAPNIMKPVTVETYEGSRNGEINQYYRKYEAESPKEQVYKGSMGSFKSFGRELTKGEFLSLSKEWTDLNENDVTELDVFFLTGLTIHPFSSEPAFKGKIWLVVDNGVASTSEYFTIFCKQTGFATVIGETTGGNGLGSAPYIAALPNSGLILNYDGYYGFNMDGSLNGEKGTQPDIVSYDGKAPLDTCIRAIDEYSKGNS